MRKAVGGEAVSAIKDREGDSHTRTPR
jgi:hypothetical protein